DLFPDVLPDVVDPHLAGVAAHGEAEGIAEAPGVHFDAGAAAGGHAGRIATAAPVGGTGLRGVGRDRAVGTGAQDLAWEQRQRARVVVLPGATRAVADLTAAVADADVEVAVDAEVQIAGVVVAARRRDVVDQHQLAAGVGDVAGEREARDAIDRALRRVG